MRVYTYVCSRMLQIPTGLQSLLKFPNTRAAWAYRTRITKQYHYPAASPDHPAQLSVSEKEGYAIVEAMCELDYLVHAMNQIIQFAHRLNDSVPSFSGDTRALSMWIIWIT